MRQFLTVSALALAAAAAHAQVSVIFVDRFLETETVVVRSDFREVYDLDEAFYFSPGPWDNDIESRSNTGPSFVRAVSDMDSDTSTMTLHASGSVTSNITVGGGDLFGFSYAGAFYGVLFEVEEPVSYRIVGQSTISSFESLTCFYIEGGDGFEVEYLDNTGPIDVTGTLEPGDYDLIVDASIAGKNPGMDDATYDWTITFTPMSPACPGDVNGDLTVNFDDLNTLLDNWGAMVTPGTQGDVDESGTVDFADMNLLLDGWGCGG